MIEIKQTEPYLSICKYPIISLLIPNTWIEEAQEIISRDEGKRNKSWSEARAIGCKAFGVYYNLKDQWIKKSKTDMVGYDATEYVIEHDGVSYKFRTHTVLHKQPGAGLDKMDTRIFKSPDDYHPIYHVVCWYSLPRLYIVGYKPNDELKDSSVAINASNIYPMFTNKILNGIDNRGFFI